MWQSSWRCERTQHGYLELLWLKPHVFGKYIQNPLPLMEGLLGWSPASQWECMPHCTNRPLAPLEPRMLLLWRGWRESLSDSDLRPQNICLCYMIPGVFVHRKNPSSQHDSEEKTFGNAFEKLLHPGTGVSITALERHLMKWPSLALAIRFLPWRRRPVAVIQGLCRDVKFTTSMALRGARSYWPYRRHNLDTTQSPKHMQQITSHISSLFFQVKLCELRFQWIPQNPHKQQKRRCL